MKFLLLSVITLLAKLTFAQSNLPLFLIGNWKIENKESYEQWDKVNETTLKGFAYKLKNDQMLVTEYLDISETKKGINYYATVLNQNQGKAVNFRLKKQDSTFTFENPNHDFPKKIIYQKINNHEVFVQVLDENQKGFSYKMQKQFKETPINDSLIVNPNYDPILAKKLGADDYGMKGYILVILKTGTNQTKDKTVISESFKGHMDNINLLVKDGKMIVAGPLSKNNKTYRGIFILSASNFEEAEKLLKNDLAIKEGLLSYDLYNWYGSAALAEYLKLSDKIWKINP